jgi:hypothetical protein
MRILGFFACILPALCGVCRADSITIQGTRHDDVYVVDAGGFYQVFSHEGKRTATVSKQRMDVSNLSIDPFDPERLQFLRQMKEDAGEEAKTDPAAPEKVRKFVLHGDPAVAAASLAAYDTAMAEEAARAGEKRRQREVQTAAEQRESAFRNVASQAAALSRSVSVSSTAETRLNEEALREAARTARMSADAQRETARAIREQTMALERQTNELRNLRETQRFRRR